jgi:hypothetical protein
MKTLFGSAIVEHRQREMIAVPQVDEEDQGT